jgi:ATP/maltotriose-dependent transcriptional regulator MalT/DNA-binding SARP family transcriptional activator
MPLGSALVLDNYQEIEGSHAFHKLVVQAVEELPRGVCIIVISRRDPPDCYARLAANGSLCLVDWNDLRLTLTETHELVAARIGAEEGISKRLHTYSDGWMAGLILAIEHATRSGSGDSEGATQEAVFDYFASQTLAREPEELGRFLTITALLPQISVPIAASLTGNAAAGDVLDDLFRRHLFTHRSSGSSRTYTYHQLFRDFLLRRLHSSAPSGALSGLKARAARLLAEAGDGQAALRLFCEIGEWSEAVRCMINEAPDLLAQGRWQTFEDRLALLPPPYLHDNAWLCYWRGMARLTIDPSGALEILDRAYSSFTQDADVLGSVLAASAAAQGIYLEAANFRKLSRWLPVLENAYLNGQVPSSAAMELQIVSALMISIVFASPGHRLMRECARRTMELMREPIDANQRLTAASATILYALYTGDLLFGRQLEALVDPIVDAAEATALNVAVWYCYLGWLGIADHMSARAADAFSKAEEIAEREDFPFVLTSSYSGRSAVMRVGEETGLWLTRAEAAMSQGRPYDIAHYIGNLLYRAADRGDWVTAVEHGQRTIDYLEEMGSIYQRLIWEVPMAWALAELGRLEEASSHLNVSRRLMSETGAVCYEAFVTLAEANLARLRGESNEYSRLLAKGFGRAARDFASGRYIFWLPTVGAPRLCADALELGIEPSFVTRYIREYPLAPPSQACEHWPWKVRIYTLGHFAVLLDGKELKFPHKVPRKPLALLKAIVAFGGVRVPLQRLLDAIWPEEDGDAAQRSFEVALHRLRRILACPEALDVTQREVSLDPTRVWTDVDALDRTLKALESDHGLHSTGAVAARVLAEYGGLFLPADDDASWAVSRRERTSARVLRVVALMGARLEAAQDWDGAIGWYEKGIEIDDVAESLYQGLIRCHSQSGRSAEALAAFQRLRRTLSIKLRVSPTAATEALVHRLPSSDSNAPHSVSNR